MGHSTNLLDIRQVQLKVENILFENEPGAWKPDQVIFQVFLGETLMNTQVLPFTTMLCVNTGGVSD